MKAAIFHEFGTPEVLRYEDVPDPEPGPGQVIVKVHATTVNRRRPSSGGDFNVALIDLAEGPRMMSRVVGIAPEDVKIGMKVIAKIEELNGAPAVLFEPA